MQSLPSLAILGYQVLFFMLQRAIVDMESQLNLKVMSIIADNENANRGLFRLLEEWRPWLVTIGCNAHGLQLVLKDIVQVH